MDPKISPAIGYEELKRSKEAKNSVFAIVKGDFSKKSIDFMKYFVAWQITSPYIGKESKDY